MKITQPAKADIIKRALASHHLGPWLPGGDFTAARQGVSSTANGWLDQDGAGQVTPKGVEWRRSHRQAEPDVFIPWTDVRDVIAKGATAANVAAYRAAAAEFGTWAREQPTFRKMAKDYTDDDWRAVEESQARYGEVTAALTTTSEAIIDAGCAVEVEQAPLLLW